VALLEGSGYGQKRLAEDLIGLTESMNRAADPVMAVPSDYLEVVAVRA
jgi:hypothetical protein